MVDYALDCVDLSHRDLVWRWRFLTAHIESRSASYNNLRFSSETNVVVSPYGGVIGTVIHRTDFENKSIFVRPGMSAGTRSSLRVHGIDGREYFGQAYGAGVNGRTTLKVRVGPKSVWGNAVGLLNAYAESGIFPADRTITIDRKTGKCRVCSSIGTIDFFGALTQSGIHFTPSESQEPSHVDDSSRSGADQRESTPSTADTQA
jgi:hypothetical protein